HRARRFQDGVADEVLGGDELEAGGLPLRLVPDCPGYFGVDVGQRAGGQRGGGGHRGNCTMSIPGAQEPEPERYASCPSPPSPSPAVAKSASVRDIPGFIAPMCSRRRPT